MSELLRLSALAVGFPGRRQPLFEGVDLTMAEGEAVALVGPSGSGKTMLARAILDLLPRSAWRRGALLWRGADPAAAPGGWAALRGRGATWLPQEPLTGLNPLRRIGTQITESASLQRGLDATGARRLALELLEELGLPEPAGAFAAWPHELSGGMRQRALLAATLACGPDLLIADEPTANLDTTVQRDLLAALDAARRVRGMALLFITHDRELVPLVATRCLELEQGQVREVPVRRTPTVAPEAAFRSTEPAPPDGTHGAAPPLLTARGLVVRHGGPRSLPAVAGVDLDLWPGHATGLVGESGAGKSSLARMLSGHLRPDAGYVLCGDNRWPGTVRGAAARAARRRIQLLFQDAGASLNPRQRVGQALREAAGGAAAPTVARLLAEVGLPAAMADRYPHTLSGGQRQRVALARCLAADPAVLVADEPTSALDADARDQVLALLTAAMAARGMAVLLVTHDLGTAASFCDTIAVMHGGVVVEQAPASRCEDLRHPQSRRLLACRPSVLAARAEWRPRSPAAATATWARSGVGCPLAGVCPLQNASCFKELPPLLALDPGHWLRCPPAREVAPGQFIDT